MAWVAVKVGINTMSVVLEMGQISQVKPSEIIHFQYNKSGIYPKFSLLYPCYSLLIPYSLTFVGVSMYAMYKLLHCATKTCYTNWCYTVTHILANKIVITTFSLVPVKYGINHTAAMGIFVWAVKQVWYYGSYLVTYIYKMESLIRVLSITVTV